MALRCMVACVFVATLSACGGDDGDGTGEMCGATRCAAGQVCCVGCSGEMSCGEACPGIACLDGGGMDGGGGDTDAGDGTCVAESDCADPMYCMPPDAPPVCGIPCMQDRLCEDASECVPGQNCVEFVAPCCSDAELSSTCEDPCTPDLCAEDFECAASGICEPIQCDSGFDCPRHNACMPGMGDAHGCLRAACTTDADCPDSPATCVVGFCYDEPGTCELPSASG